MNDNNPQDRKEQAGPEWGATLDDLLRQADPVGDAEISSSVDRLRARLRLTELSGEKLAPIQKPHTPGPAPRKRGEPSEFSDGKFGNHRRLTALSLLLAASILMLCGLITVVYRMWNNNLAPVPPARQLADQEITTPIRIPQNEVVALPEVDAGIWPPIAEPSLVQSADQFMQQLPQRITTNEPLRNAITRLYFSLEEQERLAIREELGQWLDRWDRTVPAARTELEQQWIATRMLWLPLAIDSTGSWEDEARERACIEVVASELESTAEPYLRRCVSTPKLRPIAWPMLCRATSDTSWEPLIEAIANCDELQQMASVLIERDTELSTTYLADMAVGYECREVLKNIQMVWPDGHADRCYQWATGVDRKLAMAGISLLRIIPQDRIDRKLWDDAISGRGRLLAVSLLMARESSMSRQLVASLRQNPDIAPNFPSADIQLRNWNTNGFTLSNTFRQVCTQCVIQS